MAPDTMKSYLTSIEEFIYDEKKTVTYSWLAKSLGIHSNESKQLLYEFYENFSKKKNDISATYVLIGRLKDEENEKMMVVKEKDIAAIENQMFITSKHIFSVQKSQDISDLNILYSASKENSTSTSSSSNEMSAISFNCNERNSDTIAELKHKALPFVQNAPVVSRKKPVPQSSPKTADGKKSAEKVNFFNPKFKPKASNEKLEETVEKSTDKSADKENEVTEKEKNKPAPTKTGKNAVQPKSGGIGSFFTKGNSKQNTNTKQENCKEKTGDLKSLSPKEMKSTMDEKKLPQSAKQEIEIKNNQTSTKPKNGSKKIDSSKRKRSTQKKTNKDTKKRNRLMVMSDSESDSSAEEDEVERESTPEPQPAMVVDEEVDDVVCGTPEPTTKKRKKKLVSKTFMSPDGFMETQKVYESCSEEEEGEKMPEKKFKHENGTDVNIKNNKLKSSEKTENESKKPTKIASSPQKTKQASLMSFFKKK